jgi:hypothetical protein
MSRSAHIHLALWDGEYDFQLRLGELQKLQEACDAGPLHIRRRLLSDEWKIEDVRETLRLGLMGAGMKQDEALTLIRRHVDPPYLAENTTNAFLVISASVIGVDDERLGEPLAEEGDRQSAESSPSPDSMEQEP